MADTILGSRFNLWYKPMFNLNFQSKKKGSSNNFSYGVVYFGTSITVVLAPPKSIPCPACSHPSRCSTIPSVCFMAVLHNGQGIEGVRSKWHPSCSHAKTKEKKKRGGGAETQRHWSHTVTDDRMGWAWRSQSSLSVNIDEIFCLT